MKGNIEERVKNTALYIINNNATVRSAALKFGVSKSTVHKDIRCRLPLISTCLYEKCSIILDKNKSERHIRGGMATKRKYRKLVG